MVIAAAVTVAVCFAVAFVLLRRAGYQATPPAVKPERKPYSWANDEELFMSIWRDELASMPTANVVVAFPRGAPKAAIEEWE